MSLSPTYVLGVGLSHDGSACLLRDGRILVAIEKERITRRKHDGFNDAECIAYCLDAAGITGKELSLVVQNANFSMLERGNDWLRGARALPDGVPIATISHHLAHAYSAVGTCPFERTAVLVVDGCGNAFDESIDRSGATVPEQPEAAHAHLYFEKDSFYSFDGRGLQPVFKDYSPWGLSLREYSLCPPTTKHSIGGLYAAASTYALFGMDDPGKLMGLAPYGRAGVHDFEIFDLRDGRVFVRYDWMERFSTPSRSPEDFLTHFQAHADLAYWVQREVERALVYLVRDRHARWACDNLAFAGGVALNAVANQRILDSGPFSNLYVQPAAGDNGLAIGCAYYGWLAVLGRERVPHDGSTFLGRSYGEERLRRTLGGLGRGFAVSTPQDVAMAAARLIAGGSVIGWFQGGSEFGPRALGHRSIVADPRRAGVRDRINRSIKLREDFRPFAPSVPREDVGRYFHGQIESPYMLRVLPIREEQREKFPSVVHVDGTCRVQTVTRDNERFHRLHQAFGELTGESLLLNTSLNRRGMPIVETPEEAVELFRSSPLDALVLGHFIIEKADEPTGVAPVGRDPDPASSDVDNFVALYEGALPRNACAAIIERFEKSGEARPGRVGSRVDGALKNSADIALEGSGWKDVELTLVRAAFPHLVRYIRRYPEVLAALSVSRPEAGGSRRLEPRELATLDERTLSQLVAGVLRPGRIHLQKYAAGVGGYPRWHSEIYPLDESCETLHRVLFFICYLNDVRGGGETQFLYQGVKVRPRAGDLLIAPAGFTHTHRGNVPTDGDKYIATSWFLFQRASVLYG